MDHNRLQEIENLKHRTIQSDDVDAQIALDRKYALGLTVDKDLNEAGYWYYLARRIRHAGNVFAEETKYHKACQKLNSIRQLIESEPLIIHGDTLIRCHSKERTITIPTGVKIIGRYAFYWEHNVEEVILPAGVTEIQDFSFEHNVRRVIIPYGVKTLGRGAFSSEEIEELVLPEGILEIPSYAFGFGLRSITIPSSVTKIGNEAFDRCSKLRTIKHVSSDIARAVHWVKKLLFVKGNLSPGQKYLLALELMQSKLTGEEGLRYLKESAEAGYVRAIKLLIRCLEKGYFCDKDSATARIWKSRLTRS